MIYESEARARAVAALLNEKLGNPPAYTILTDHGWSVIATYSNPNVYAKGSVRP